MASPVLSTLSSASNALKSILQPLLACSILAKLSPKIISGGAMPNFLVMSSIGPAFRIGSLRVVMRKPSLSIDVSASWLGTWVSRGAPLSDDIIAEGAASTRDVKREVLEPTVSAAEEKLRRSCSEGCSSVGLRPKLPLTCREPEVKVIGGGVHFTTQPVAIGHRPTNLFMFSDSAASQPAL